MKINMADAHANDGDNISVMLSCEICLEEYDDSRRLPKLLPCHHSFCRQCLNGLTGSKTAINCPSCRRIVQIPPEGVSGLQTNFYVTKLKDLMFSSKSTPTSRSCRVHKNVMLTEFCRLCEVPVCKECQKIGHPENDGHSVVSMKEAVNEQTIMLTMAINETKECISQNKKQLKLLDTEKSALFASKENSNTSIDRAFDSFIEELNKRRMKLKIQLSEKYQQTHAEINSQIEYGVKNGELFTDLLHECEISKNNGVLSDIIAYRTKAASRNRDFKLKRHNQACNKSIKFEIGPSTRMVNDVIEDLGQLKNGKSLPCSVKFHEHKVIASLVTTLAFTVLNSTGEYLSNYPIQVEITDVFDDDIPCFLQSRDNGRYEVTFRPQVSGAHQFRVNYMNTCTLLHHMLHVQSNDPVGYLGTLDGLKVEYPRDVSVDTNNNIYIMDTGHGCIQIYDKNGTFIKSILIDSMNPEISSCGVTVDSYRKQLICTEVSLQESNLSTAKRLIIFNLDGSLSHILDLKDYVKQALSVAVMPNGHMVVCDYQDHCLCIIDRKGSMLKRIGGHGDTPGRFNHPTFVCLGDHARIFVADCENHRILVFDKNGEYVFHFGSHGNGKGQLNMPFGLATDCHGNLIVVDGCNNRIQIYKQENGDFVGSVESLGDRLSAPRGVCVTADGYIYVADRNNNCIKKFKYILCSTI